MGFLSGTPALICIQPRVAHPRNSFLGKCIMTRLERSTTVGLVCIFFLRKLWEGKKWSSRATPYIIFCWTNNAFPWKHVKRILVGFVFLDLSFNVVLIDSYVELITFQRKSLSHVARYATMSPPRERKSLISIFHTMPSTQCEKYYGLMGKKKHDEYSIQLHATALFPELLFCTKRSNVILFFSSSDMIYERILLLRDALLYYLSIDPLKTSRVSSTFFFFIRHSTSRAKRE